jgi:hypothetical protein
MKKPLLFFALITLLGRPILAQSSSGQPKPGPQHARLGYLIGSWKIEGEDKSSRGGKMAGTTTCEWYEDRFFVICRSDFSSPAIKQLEIFGYDPDVAAYTRYFIASGGSGGLETNGKVNGKTWEWTTRIKKNGKSIEARGIVTEVSPDSWTSNETVSIDGGPAKPTYETKATRIKK